MNDIPNILEGLNNKLDQIESNFKEEIGEYRHVLEQMYKHSIKIRGELNEYEEHKKHCKCTKFINSK